MQYRVIGVNRETGRDLDTMIEATDKTDAAKKAMDLGAVISKIIPMPVPDEQIDELSEAIADKSDLNQRLSTIPKTHPPKYFWLTILGQLYCVVGGLSVLLAAIFALLILLNALFSSGGNDSLPTFYNLVYSAVMGFVALAIGQLLLGFRDMARNSWHLPELARLIRSSYVEKSH